MKMMKIFSAGMLLLLGTLLYTPSQAQCHSSKSASQGNNNHSSAYGGVANGHDDIVDIAVSEDGLSTLVAAVKAAQLVETLKSDGPFTVFAPTNEAFNALPKGTLSDLLKPENKDQLVKILTYHVVPGTLLAGDLGDGQRASTVQGGKVKVTLTEGGVLINDARVVSADVKASNGVVHVIDRVILPPAH